MLRGNVASVKTGLYISIFQLVRHDVLFCSKQKTNNFFPAKSNRKMYVTAK